jgi:hypothetical protein
VESVLARAREWHIATPKDPVATATLKCRLEFLGAAAKHPKIRLGDTLREKVFKPIEQKWADLGLPPVTHMERWIPERHAPLLQLLFADRARLIMEWAAGHNLPYEWVYAEAERTFMPGMFSASPFKREPAYAAPVFIWPPWSEGVPAREYRRRAITAFKKQLDWFIQGVKLERSRFLNHRDPYSQKIQYCWAAEHVCLQRKFSLIARDARPERTEQAVGKAVGKILARIGIPSHTTLGGPKTGPSRFRRTR